MVLQFNTVAVNKPLVFLFLKAIRLIQCACLCRVRGSMHAGVGGRYRVFKKDALQ